jgi:hypothetical protein
VAAGLASAATPAAAARSTFYVSPKGNDQSQGTASRPFRTLAQARDAVRAANRIGPARDIRVILRGGTHRLLDTFTLTGGDSGRGKHLVTYAASPGAHPVISGAVPVKGFALYNKAKNIYRAKVANPGSFAPRQLYVNGRRAIRARGPSTPGGFYRTPGGYVTSDSSMASWGNQQDIELVTNVQWKQMRCMIASIKSNSIAMQQPCWANANVFPYLWSFQLVQRVENAFELLDSAGEWYLDRSAGYLYYIPRVGENIKTADVELPALEALVDGKGTLSKPIRNIRFQGLTFSYGTWLSPSGPNGYAADQSGFHLDGTGHPQNVIGHDPNTVRTSGNVKFSYARNVNFVRNTFTHLGGSGLDFNTGSQRNSIIGNYFTDISSSALLIGGNTLTDAHPSKSGQTTRDNQVTNNLITKIGRDYQDAAGIYLGFTTRSVVANNDISDVPWAGIAVGWGWGLYDPGSFLGLPGATPNMWGTYTTPTASQGNIVVGNRIERFLGVLWDGGAIYTQGQQGTSMENGEVIAGNVASGKRGLAGGNTFYTDGGSRYVSLDGNVAFNNSIGITDFGPCGKPDSLALCFVNLPYGSDSGGCRPYGDIAFNGNYWQHAHHYWDACPYENYPVNVVDKGNQVIAGPGSVSSQILSAAGRQGRYRASVGAK